MMHVQNMININHFLYYGQFINQSIAQFIVQFFDQVGIFYNVCMEYVHQLSFITAIIVLTILNVATDTFAIVRGDTAFDLFQTKPIIWMFNIFHESMSWLNRYRIINDRQDREPYLERYYLFIKGRTGIWEYFPFNIMLHRFLKSDPDDLHDHPWPYCTIILRGGYWEHTVDKRDDDGEIISTNRTWWGPGSIRFAPATQLHRIELPPADSDGRQEIWTLFIPGIKKREWGFVTKSGWINNYEYLENKKHVN